MAEFLNALTESTKTVIIKETQDSLQTLIDNRIKFANRTKEHLRFKAKLKASEDIQALSDSLKIAQSLNIKNNNFHLLKKTVGYKRIRTPAEQNKTKRYQRANETF